MGSFLCEKHRINHCDFLDMTKIMKQIGIESILVFCHEYLPDFNEFKVFLSNPENDGQD